MGDSATWGPGYLGWTWGSGRHGRPWQHVPVDSPISLRRIPSFPSLLLPLTCSEQIPAITAMSSQPAMWSCVRIPCLCLCLFMLPACSLCVALPVLRCQELFSALLCMLLPSLPWVLSPCFLLSPCCLASAGLSSWLVTFFFSVQHTFVHNEPHKPQRR